MTVTVTIRGPLFSKKIDQVVKDAIVAESLLKIQERVERPGRRLGRKNNRLSSRRNALVLDVASTLRDPSVTRQRIPSFGSGRGRRPNPQFNPRSRGTAWVRKHVGGGQYGKGIIGAMAPAVLRKTAQRIIGELS
jgi:hypothetical protein